MTPDQRCFEYRRRESLASALRQPTAHARARPSAEPRVGRASEQHLTGLRLAQARQHRQQGRLSSAVAAENGQALAGPYGESEIAAKGVFGNTDA